MSDLISGDRRVLVFSAHAADFCSRAGGTIARLTEAGSSVHIVDFSYGERCESPALWARDPQPSIEEIKSLRAEEMQQAAQVLGVTIECLDFGDSPLLIGPERRQQLLELFRYRQPNSSIDALERRHSPSRPLRRHRSRHLGQSLLLPTRTLKAAPPCPAPQVLFYETTLGTAPVAHYVPNLFVDISPSYERKCQALSTAFTLNQIWPIATASSPATAP